MSWSYHSDYFGWQIDRQVNDATGKNMMSYRAKKHEQELHAKNLDGIKQAVREAEASE